MYLSREDLLTRFPELKIEASNSDFPFNPDLQVKVCSIDLRVDNVFWKEKKYFKPIDLNGSKTLEISPRRFWKRIFLRNQHSITLKPGEYILGRTYEEFEIPNDLAGKITTRSSYSRIGLETSFTCDLINPGWRGHVPLELKNNSKNSIKIYPYLPLVQIFLIPLSKPVDFNYSDKKVFKSKYMNDDGGPSYWWRDDLVSLLYSKVHQHQISEEFASEIVNRFKETDSDGVYRLDKFLHSLKPSDFTNIDEIDYKFKKKELANFRINKFKNILFYGAFPACLMASIGIYYEQPHTYSHTLFWVFTLFTAPFFFYQAFFSEPKQFYTK